MVIVIFLNQISSQELLSSANKSHRPIKYDNTALFILYLINFWLIVREPAGSSFLTIYIYAHSSLLLLPTILSLFNSISSVTTIYPLYYLPRPLFPS